MKANDVMSRKVITITPETSIAEAARIMISGRVSGLPVLDDNGSVLGIITEGDLLRRTEVGTERTHPRWLTLLASPGRMAQEYVHSHGRKVDELMTKEVVFITPETPLADVVATMEARGVKRLPVIENKRLVGIVSRADLLRALEKILAQESVSTVSTDAEIRRRVLAEIDKQPWGPRTTVDATVESGVVTIHGVVIDERERDALHVLVENTLGVKSLRDDVVTIEPMSGMVVGSIG